MKRGKSEKALMKAGKMLFWKHGIRRVAVEELCAEASVSKMTFYRKFEHKYDLALQILADMMDENIAEYDEIMASDLDYPTKITQVMEFKQRQAKATSMELVKDIFSGGEEYAKLKGYLQETQLQFMSQLRSDFQKAKDEGFIRKELKVDVIIHMLYKMRQFGEEDALMSMYDNMADLTRDLMSMFFYGIMKK